MKEYIVGFIKDNIYQSNIVRTEKSPVEVGLYYKDLSDHVYSVDYATPDNMKPGIPIINI